MHFAIAIALFAVPVVTGVLIDGKSRERSLVLATDQKDVLADLNDLDPQTYLTRNRRAASALELIEFKVDVKIRYRYSKTYVTSHVRNSDSRAQEVTFQVILPETAFISKFVMEIDHIQYEAYVKEKEEAKADYDRAKSRGQSAGLLELNARHANVFNVNVNIKAGSIVWFNLTYEELLSRRFGRYEQAITLNGDEISKNNDVRVRVSIEESQELKHVRAYNYQNELETTDSEGSKKVDIDKDGKNRATIMWRPSSKTDILKRFVIQYDVKREVDSGEVLIMNGYFVHFFSPPKLKPLQKHVVFVLDVSGSMGGKKIVQLKEAMREILKDLHSKDYINLVIFSDTVTVWSPGDVYTPRYDFSGRGVRPESERPPLQPFRANSKTIQDAKSYIDSLTANGGTNINDALVEALTLIARFKKARDDNEKGSDKNKAVASASPVEILEPRTESMILFLTDGEPTSGETNLEKIQKNIQLGNLGLSVPLFSLAFGTGADFTFLRKLSLQNHAFARKIYEAADASLQLQGFYAEISSPLLSNVQFNYTSPDSPYAVSEMTRTTFPTFYKGWELPVAGKIEPSRNKFSPGNSDETPEPTLSSKIAHTTLLPYPPTDHCHFYTDVSGIGYDGLHHWHRPMIYVPHRPWWCYPPPPPTPVTTTPKPPTDEDTFLERLWAYLTIQNLIEKDLAGVTESGESAKQRALRLALQYSFVTAQTSLVVVKPESKDVANAESVDDRPSTPAYYAAGGGLSSKGARPIAFRKGSLNMVKVSGSRGSGNAPMAPSFDTAQTEEEEESVKTSGGGNYEVARKSVRKKSRPPSQHHTTTKLQPPTQQPTTKPEPPTTKSMYTLQDLKWLLGDMLTIDDINDGTSRDYRVAKSEKEITNSAVGSECTIGNNGSKLNKVTGKCQHLKNCIHNDFVDDFDVYQDSYFCPIKSTASSEMFAGACCEKA